MLNYAFVWFCVMFINRCTFCFYILWCVYFSFVVYVLYLLLFCLIYIVLLCLYMVCGWNSQIDLIRAGIDTPDISVLAGDSSKRPVLGSTWLIRKTHWFPRKLEDLVAVLLILLGVALLILLDAVLLNLRVAVLHLRSSWDCGNLFMRMLVCSSIFSGEITWA